MSIRDDEKFAELEAALWQAEDRLYRVRFHVGDPAAIRAAEMLVSEAAAALNSYIASPEKSRVTP